MKTPTERGLPGARAYRARDDAGPSVAQLVEQLRARGSGVTICTIRGIEGGSKRPGRRLFRELATIYRSVPPGEMVDGQSPDLAAAVAGLTRKLAAMRRKREGPAVGMGGNTPGLGEGQVRTVPLGALAPQPLEGA